MAKKRKTLPKNFEELIEKKDIKNLIKVFDICELEATGGYGKSTAFSTYYIPNELVRWLVEKGANIDATDIYGCTALHRHATFHTPNNRQNHQTHNPKTLNLVYIINI